MANSSETADVSHHQPLSKGSAQAVAVVYELKEKPWFHSFIYATYTL